eukprot:gnl/MRDRNA2_/MRDRNA2_147707_c0_seq1.p1 gnl/MRDRNA2_/MRDRNA2_147707_c0~~gnl/MRDRNA2_/MRDRNA2_147707_c0_seq1.p1  ORF type:complete len:208 (-),score=35.24 gnl/MRDRNA2_/MRDRNA2_147707_c0_seq1:98-721(-)
MYAKILVFLVVQQMIRILEAGKIKGIKDAHEKLTMVFAENDFTHEKQVQIFANQSKAGKVRASRYIQWTLHGPDTGCTGIDATCICQIQCTEAGGESYDFVLLGGTQPAYGMPGGAMGITIRPDPEAVCTACGGTLTAPNEPCMAPVSDASSAWTGLPSIIDGDADAQASATTIARGAPRHEAASRYTDNKYKDVIVVLCQGQTCGA